jgi:hypothetical protein
MSGTRLQEPEAETQVVQEHDDLRELTDYELAVEQFKVADRAYKEAEEEITSGDFLRELFANAQGDVDRAQRDWHSRWEGLQSLLSDRNTKLKSAQNAFRQAVQLAPTQWRDWNGQSTKVNYEGFEASSVTSRRFEPASLFRLLREKGKLEEALALSKINSEGKEERLIQEAWKIDYEGMLNWLQANNLLDVLAGSYDETEKTPQVRGPKPLTFLGEKKE